KLPREQSRLRKLLYKVLGQRSGKGLETTGAEVVSVPKSKSSWLKRRLASLGTKVIILRETWNHILKRHQEPMPMTANQQAAVDKITNAPETINLGMLKMPEAAVVELALKAEATEQDRFAKVVLPLSDGTDITLIRTLPTVKTDGGFTWSGK